MRLLLIAAVASALLALPMRPGGDVPTARGQDGPLFGPRLAQPSPEPTFAPPGEGVDGWHDAGPPVSGRARVVPPGVEMRRFDGDSFPLSPDSLPEVGTARAAVPELVGGTPEWPDYWIVSSRRCPQSGRPNCTPDRFDYYHALGQYRPRTMNKAAFEDWLLPGVPVCVVIHGSYASWEDTVDGVPGMYQWIRAANRNQPIQIVFFTWPSEGPLTILPQVDIGILGRRAAFNGFYIAQLMDLVPQESPISLFGHSHGTRAVSAALHLLGGGEVQGHRLCRPAPVTHRVRTVFAAAAIDHNWINPGDRYGRALTQTEALLNMENEEDLALLIYPLRRPFAHQALGRHGFDSVDLRQLGRLASKVATLDVTPLIGPGHFWEHYYRRPEISSAARSYWYFDDRPAGAPPLEARTDRRRVLREPARPGVARSVRGTEPQQNWTVVRPPQSSPWVTVRQP